MRRSTAMDACAQGCYPAVYGWSVLSLRLVMGWLMLWAGWSKLTAEGGWTAEFYLAAAQGPLADWFQSMAGSGFVDGLNVWGQILVGLALLLGVFVRPASVLGALMMLLYFLSGYPGNAADGFVQEHIVFLIVFFFLFASGSGHVWGLDGLLERRLDHRASWAKIFFG